VATPAWALTPVNSPADPTCHAETILASKRKGDCPMIGFWRGLLAVVVVVVATSAVGFWWLTWRLEQETVTPLSVVNSGGTAGKALVVYQPGIGSFQERVTTAFIDELAVDGWQVSTTTASREAPATLADYDLVVVAAPIYGGAAAKPLARYVARVGDFRGTSVVVLLTGAGDTAAAIAGAEKLVEEAGGHVIRSLALTTMRPNDEDNRYTGSNTERAIAMARDAARGLEIGGP
jgi:hypothetical protein